MLQQNYILIKCYGQGYGAADGKKQRNDFGS